MATLQFVIFVFFECFVFRLFLSAMQRQKRHSFMSTKRPRSKFIREDSEEINSDDEGNEKIKKRAKTTKSLSFDSDDEPEILSSLNNNKSAKTTSSFDNSVTKSSDFIKPAISTSNSSSVCSGVETTTITSTLLLQKNQESKRWETRYHEKEKECAKLTRQAENNKKILQESQVYNHYLRIQVEQMKIELTHCRNQLDKTKDQLKSDSSLKGDYTCTVCMHNNFDTVLHCGHVFCNNCIEEWKKTMKFKQQVKCPLCNQFSIPFKMIR
jgi:hypothetical protein